MQIIFDNKRQLFHLANDDFSYYFRITSDNSLQHLYFGAYLSEIDEEECARLAYDDTNVYYDYKSQKEVVFPDCYGRGLSLNEFAIHGGADKRQSPLIFSNNGIFFNDFKYVEHEIIVDVINYPDTFPHFHAKEGEAKTLIITLKDVLSEVYVKLYYTILKDLPVIIKNYDVINKTGHDIDINRAYSMMQDFNTDQFELTHFCGHWAFERQLTKEKLTDGIKRISSNFNKSAHDENPGIILSSINATENQGLVYGINLVYSGSFACLCEVNRIKTTRLLIGINDEDFCYQLHSDETFTTPQAIIAISNNGYGPMSRVMHKAIFNHLISTETKNRHRHVLLNSWEGCYFDFDTQKVIEFVDQSKVIGADLFVLDDGWFGHREDDRTSLGDWFVNESKVDLAKVSEHIHSLNMKFGLWFEPEMISIDSQLYKAHPEYALGFENYNLTLIRHQLMLDLSKDEVVQYVVRKMSELIDLYHIDYLKIDHNRYATELYSRDSNYNQGSIAHRVVMGSYKIYSALKNRYPDLLIENCSAGGARFDLGMLYYTPQIWTSDETDSVVRSFIQFSTSYLYPLSSMGAHVNNNPRISYKEKAMVALFGTYGFEFDPRKIKQSDIDEILEINEIYKKYHFDCIMMGELYRLRNPYTDNAMSMISVNKDKTKAVMLYTNLLKHGAMSNFVKIDGLDDNKYYYNSFDNKVHLGSYYRQVGLNFTIRMKEMSFMLITFDQI